MSSLRAENLFKTYSSRDVVNDISLYINSGEVVGLLGPNGAGKTTSFYMMVGLVSADAGHIFLNDTDISRLPMHRRALLGIGYLPQEASVFRKLSVEDNIRAILQSLPDLSAEQVEAETDELLRELHISHIRDSLGMSLSGGERRRVEIARALATRPDFILLDEPFAGVDPLSVVDINSIIKHLRELGIGVLITDHNVRETLGICERAYIMNAGKIIAEGDPESLLADEHVREVYLGQHFTL
jgi:lipopolysaccharide export system ATP-binding protein